MTNAFKDHFSTTASGYHAFRPGYPPALFAWLASVSPGRERAVDLGCGTGQASVALASHFAGVIAVDPSRGQIAPPSRTCACHISSRPPRLRASRTRPPTSSLPPRPALVDPARLHPELARIARPGAVFAAFTYGLCRVGSAVDELVDRLYRGILDAHWPPERAHVDAAYRPLPFPWPELDAPSLHRGVVDPRQVRRISRHVVCRERVPAQHRDHRFRS